MTSVHGFYTIEVCNVNLKKPRLLNSAIFWLADEVILYSFNAKVTTRIWSSLGR